MTDILQCPRCGSEISPKNRFCFNCDEVVEAPPEQDPLLGRNIADKYKIEAPIGSGAMGCVYRAEHLALKRSVALKILHAHLARDPSLVQRFMREARAASRLSHANIVTLLDFGQDPKDGLLYLVMEFIQGRPLSRVLDEEGPLDFQRIAVLTRQILLAIDEAHAHGVVHRDLKPDNIIVIPTRHKSERVKVVDFGLAQMMGTEDPRLTATGLIFGTPSYLSPEQARSVEVGPASDIYSFGVILYELTTGKLPFTATNVFELVNKHLTDTPMHPGQRAPQRNISPEVAGIILRCLEKSPERRFSSAMELHDALVRALSPEHSATETLPHQAPGSKEPLEQTIPLAGRGLNLAPPTALPEEKAPPTVVTASPPSALGLRCRACGQPMAPEVKFCGSCGMPAATVSGACPSCGAPCQPGERFCTSCGAVLTATTQTTLMGNDLPLPPVASVCSACGAPLTALEPACTRCGEPNPSAGTDQTLEYLKKYIPPGVVDAILQARSDIATQRRNVTVLFADVTGFKTLSENRDPEEVVRLMNLCFEGLVEAVHRYGGTVDKFIGDCVMAVFGAPTAHEDDPERSVRAAFDMMDSLESLNRTLPVPLTLRIGINTGPVVAGAVGVSSRLNYTVIGDTVNIAQHLQEAADLGKILVSEPVYEACRKAIRFKPLPNFQPKGRKQRLAPYQAESLILHGEESLSAVALVGRSPERRLLEEAGSQAIKGQGSALLLTGEPGIGKTALLLYAADVLKRLGIRTHLVRARIHDVGSRAVADLLRSFLGCSMDAKPEDVRNRLAERASLGLDLTDQQILAHLTSSGQERATLPPDLLEVASSTAMRRIVKVQVSLEPTAVLIDDVRNLSGKERTLLLTLADVTRHAALLLIVTDRQDSLRLWSHEGFRQIDVGPLHPNEANRFLHKFVEGRPLNPDLAERLLQAAGGNPLYLTEMAKFLEEKGQLALQGPRDQGTTSLTIPEGLRQIVLARFDTMDPTMKRALIYAAVIGRSFTLGLLSRLAGDAHTLSTTVEKLVEQGMLEYDPTPGIVKLKFRHEMVREVLYDLITQKTQKAIHNEVATLLLAQAGGEINPEEIGNQLEKAGRDAEAADLFERAGNEHAAHCSWAEAAIALRKAVTGMERAQAVAMVRRQDTPQRLLSLKTKMAHTLNQANQWEEAKKVALEAKNIALQTGEPIFGARAARQLGRAISEQGKLSEADHVLDEAYRTALQCGDLDLAADLASDLGEVRERAGDLRGATTILMGALDMLDAAVKRSRVTQLAASGGRVAEVLNRLGRVALRSQRIKDALSYWQAALKQACAAQDHLLAARVQGNLGNAQAMSGDPGAALKTLNQALQAAQNIGDRLGAAKLLHNLARLHLQASRPEQAEALARESFDLSMEIGWREGEAMGAALLEQLAVNV